MGTRPAFLQLYPQGMTADQFVNKLFDTAQLIPYTTERQQAIQALISIRRRAPRYFATSSNLMILKQREYNSAFVLMQYFGYCGGIRTQGGYDFWLNILNNVLPNDPSGYRSMVCAFITSAEYQDRFGSTHTHSNADCH